MITPSDSKRFVFVRLELTALLATLLLGSAVRIYQLGAESFWLDEIYSAQVIQAPLSKIIDRIPNDKPPLDYYAQALFDHGHHPEFWHRLPSALFGVILLIGLYAWVRGWFGRRIALIVLVIAALHPFLLRYSQEARPYMLFGALFVWQQAVFAAWWRGRGMATQNPKRAVLLLLVFCVLSVLSIYTLYAALMVCAGNLAFLVIASLREARVQKRGFAWARALGWFALVMGITLLAAAPLYSRAQLEPPSNYFWGFDEPSLRRLLLMAESYMFGEALETIWLDCATIGLLLLVGFGVLRAWRLTRAGTLHFLLTGLALLPVTLAIYHAINRSFYTRYCFQVAPSLCVFSGIAIWYCFRRSSGRAMGAAVLLGLINLFVFEQGRPYRADWKAASQYITAHAQPGDEIVVTSGIERTCIQYYLTRLGSVLPVRVESEWNAAPGQKPVWQIAQLFNAERKLGKPVFGLSIERLTHQPPVELFERLAGGDPTIWLGKCPSELLSAGWDRPEAWSADFVVRWAVGLNVSVFIPVSQETSGTLTIAMMPYDYPGAPEQRIRATFAGHPLEAKSLPHGTFTELQWPVPAVPRGFASLDLEFSYLETPSKVTKNYADFRTLAAAASWMRWEPAR